MKITPQLDTGPVMMNAKIKIYKDTNYKMLSDQLSLMGAEMILKSLNQIENNQAKFIDQIDQKATYAKKISKNEAKIDWGQKAEKIIAKINALHINPGCWFELKGSRVKITKAIEVPGKGLPGEILADDFTIACGENAIKVLELTKEGKSSMSISNFLAGNKIRVGLNLNK